MPSTRKRGSAAGGRKRRSGRALHPDHLWRLFKKAGTPTKLLASALLLFSLVGLAYLVVPFTVDIDHPIPPPFTLRMSCPPPVVSAVAGSGGLPDPLPSVAGVAEVHDGLCGAFGRQRALTGLLMTAAGLLNAAALLEWARIRRRSKRRRRREHRRSSHPQPPTPPQPGAPPRDAPIRDASSRSAPSHREEPSERDDARGVGVPPSPKNDTAGPPG
jgi:hypothetical protein